MVSPGFVAERGADQRAPSRRDARCDLLQRGSPGSGFQVVEDIEHHDVPGELREGARVTGLEFHHRIRPRDPRGGHPDFCGIGFDAENPLVASGFPQIGREEPDPASDVQQRKAGFPEQRGSGGIGGIP
jgi:hypothetical protein